MSTPCLLSIGIATIPERENNVIALTEEIQEQFENCGFSSNTVHLAVNSTERRRDGGPTIAFKRNELIDLAVESNSLFHVQFDDDDQIVEDYIERVLSAIDYNPNAACIGYEIEVQHIDGKKELACVSNKFEDWHHKLDPSYHGGYTYKQAPYFKIPIRTEFCAKAKPAPKLIKGEDYDFCQRLRPYLSGRNEVFIPKPLYFYNNPINTNGRY